jgi:hypothetical protein
LLSQPLKRLIVENVVTNKSCYEAEMLIKTSFASAMLNVPSMSVTLLFSMLVVLRL